MDYKVKLMRESDCFAPHCDEPAQTRGLCSKCYTITKSAIIRNLVSDDELVKQGKILPKAKRQGRKRSATLAWLIDEEYTNRVSINLSNNAHPVVKQIVSDLQDGNEDIVVKRVEDGVEL